MFQKDLVARVRRELGVHNNPLKLKHSNSNNNNSTNENHNNHHRYHHHDHHHHHNKERRHDRDKNPVFRISSIHHERVLLSRKERILLSQDFIKREYLERDKLLYMKKKAEKDGSVKCENKDGFTPKTYPPKRYCEESLQQTLASFSEETKISDTPVPNDVYCGKQ